MIDPEKEPDAKAQWLALREQFAPLGESLSDSQAAQLIQQWLSLHHSSQHQSFSRQLALRGSSLQQLIKQVLSQQKSNHYLLVQQYDLSQAQLISQQVLEKAHKISHSQQEEPLKQPQVSQTMQKDAEDADIGVQKRDQMPQSAKKNEMDRAAQFQVNLARVSSKEDNFERHRQEQWRLPMLQSRGKVYNPEQMASHFELQPESLQQYQLRSPSMFERRRQIPCDKSQIFSSKYLKMAFDRFCRQAYNSHGLFGDFFKQADKMNLNKWMVFCKQFDLVAQLKMQSLVEIFHTAANFNSTMDLQQFLTAVALLQQKYLQKYHKGHNFVDQVLNINSEAAFRVKMENLKVRYGGPNRNSFEMATYPEHLRLEEIQREKEFKNNKQKRDAVLIKGMYQEHIQEELKRLKEARQAKHDPSSPLRNHSTHHPVPRYPEALSPPRTQNNYSKIFHIKQQTNGRKTSKTPATLNSTHLPQASQSVEPSISGVHSTQPAAVREWGKESEPSVWLTRLRSDSEQSDQILKEHLQLQKKMAKSRLSLKPAWRREMQQQSRRVDQIKLEMSSSVLHQQQQQLQQTGAGFNVRPKAGLVG